MEFPVCPACKASVLEDDAVDCPFCGASMSGKPSAKPPAKPAPGKPAAKPGAVAPAKPSSPAKPGAPAPKSSPPPAKGRPARDDDDDAEPTVDDPFEVDSLAHQQASPVSPKAAKSRTIEVKCPMCETVGYIATTQYGKQIKCCNPGCRMPIFQAPPVPVVKEEVEKPSGFSTPVITLLGLLVAGVVGGAVWYFVLREEPKSGPINPSPDDLVVDQVVLDKIDNVVKETKEPPPATLPEMQKQSLKAIVDAAQKRDGVRNKTLARQLTAEAYLLAGQKSEAEEQLSRLKTVDKNTTFYAISPHAMQAEAALKAGDKAGADAALQLAMDLVPKLPDVGRQPLDTVPILAAALIQADRTDDAKKLLASYAQGDSRSRTAMTALWRGSVDSGTFDIAAIEELPFNEFSGQTLYVTTTGRLCSRGQWDPALAWAKTAPDAVTADACLAAWAAMRTRALHRKPDPAGEAALTAEMAAAGPSGKIRMTAATALVRLQIGDRAGAEKGRDELLAFVGAVMVPTPRVPPSMKAIYASKGKPFAGLPDPRPGKSLALAVADVSNLQIKLGDNAGGWTTLQKSLDLLRGTTPGSEAAQRLVDQCADNKEVIKSLLEKELSLDRQETVRTAAFNQYRVQCQVLLKESQERFSLQEALLSRAARAGLLTEVWGVVLDRDQGEMDHLEPYRMKSTVPLAVWLGANTLDQKEMLATIMKAYDKTKQPKAEMFLRNGLLEDTAKIETLFKPNKIKPDKIKPDTPANVAAAIKQLYANKNYDRQVIDRYVLSLIGRLAKTDLAVAFEHARLLSDPPIREDALRLLAGWSVVQGKGPDFWKLLGTPGAKGLQPLDREALFLGLIEAIQVVEGSK